MIKRNQITAVILAGGQARRLNNQDKGLIRLNKKPLISHIIATIKNQVGAILINANRNQKRYQALTNCQVISDDIKGFQGPLAGMLKAMKTAKTPYLLVLPCDSPNIDKNLLNKLKRSASKVQADISVAHDGKRLQPTFALLKVSLAVSLGDYLAQGGRKIDLWYQMHSVVQVDFSADKHFFDNLNYLVDYARLTQISHSKKVPIIGFAAFSGTGKTTLIVKLITRLKTMGLRVAFVKHAHHNFDIDHRGKDSYQCYQAGAAQVLISSEARFALINRYPSARAELGLFALLAKLDLAALDIIIVEGFKNENIKKIELRRQSLKKPALSATYDNIIAVAKDKYEPKLELPCLHINNLDEITDFVLAYANLSTFKTSRKKAES